VWDYQIAQEWARDAEAFSAFVKSLPGGCTMEAIDEFIYSFDTCLAKGTKAAQQLQEVARKNFSRMEKLAERDGTCVFGVLLHEDIPYDTKYFADLCARNFPPAVLLRVSLFNLGATINVGVTRSSEQISSCGAACRTLHEKDARTYQAGGGHPFAAGLQVTKARFNLQTLANDLLEEISLVSRI